MISSKNFLKLVCLALLITNTYIVALFYTKSKEASMIKEEKKLKKNLEYFHATCHFETVLAHKLSEFFHKIENKKVSDMNKIFNNWCKEIDLPEKAFTIIAFNVILNSKGEPIANKSLNAPDKEKLVWEHYMSTIDTMHKNDFVRENRNYVKQIHIDKPNALIKKPYKIMQVAATSLNTYAIWFNATKKVAKDRVNSIFVFIHDIYIKSRITSIVKQYFKINTINEKYYGYLNKFEPEKHCLPDGLSATEIMKELNNYELQSGYKTIDKFNLLAYIKPNGNIFIALKRKPNVPIPLWTLSLIFIWFPIWYKHYINSSDYFKASLGLLYKIMLFLIFMLPATLIGDYWNKMISSKLISIKNQKIAYMFNNLVQLDTLYSESVRINKNVLKQMFNIVAPTKNNPLGVSNKTAFQNFIDETVKNELNLRFDTCIILDSNKRIIRQCPTSASFYRLLASQPKFYKNEIVEQYMQCGWVPKTGEYEHIDIKNEKYISIKQFMGLNPNQMKKSIIPVSKIIGIELINLYNYKNKKELKQKQEKGSISTSSILATALGGESEEYISTFYNKIGDYVPLTLGKDAYLLYSNLLFDKNKRAKYSTLLISESGTISRLHMNNLFTHKKQWSKDVNYLAITKMKSPNYPYLDLWKRFKTILDIMKPPLTQYISELNINGIPHIACFYLCNKNHDYVLAALMPISVIYSELNTLLFKMLLAAFAIFGIILLILMKIYKSTIVPMKSLMHGINSIETKKLDHFVKVDSKDEWEKVAETLNQSIETMQQLQIATFLQNTILPTNKTLNENISFTGVTVSADDIGGDYYDVFIPQKNQMMFLFGDVSGHSVGAALVVSMAHAGFASFFDDGIKDPSIMLNQFNSLMLNNLKKAKMMTCFAGFIDDNGNLTYSNAGQTFPLIVDEYGNIKKISYIAFPLGVTERTKYDSETIKLPDKCRIVLYSDGIAEAMNNENEPFGYDRIEQAVREVACKNTADFLKERLYKELKNYTKETPWNDDCTIAIIEYNRLEKQTE